MKTHLDLFSGIGGFALAARACGLRTVGFCEKEPYAQQILKERFGSKPRIHPDISTINGADYAGVDLLTGGFPCQPFSVAGKRRGAADDRALWPEMLRVVNEAKPRWVIGENVAGIINMELDRVLSDLESIGYSAWPIVIPACAVDARHRRDRVWIMAYRKEFWSNGGERGQHQAAGEIQRQAGRSGGTLADSASQQIPWQGSSGLLTEPSQCCRWEPEPAVGRVANGIPNRVDRLRGLGNAIVPQVAVKLIRGIQKVDAAGRESITIEPTSK